MTRVIVVIGPTSVGKTKMGVELAKAMNGDYNLTEIDYIDFVPSVLIAHRTGNVRYCSSLY